MIGVGILVIISNVNKICFLKFCKVNPPLVCVPVGGGCGFMVGEKKTSPDEDAPVDCLFFYDLVAAVCLGLVHGAVYPVKNALCRVVG